MPLAPWRGALSAALRATLALALVVLPLAAVFLTSVQPSVGPVVRPRPSGTGPRCWATTARSTPRCAACALAAAAASAGDARWASPSPPRAAAALETARRRALRRARHRARAGACWSPSRATCASCSSNAWPSCWRWATRCGCCWWPTSRKHLAFGVRNAVRRPGAGRPVAGRGRAACCGAHPLRAFLDATLPQLAALVTALHAHLPDLRHGADLVACCSCPPASDVLGTLLFELQSYADPGSAGVHRLRLRAAGHRRACSAQSTLTRRRTAR